MNWLGNLNAVTAYIERHLTDTPDTAQIARTAGCSEFQLLRMFPYPAGMRAAEYIRRRRM